jgi:hypothetical protein
VIHLKLNYHIERNTTALYSSMYLLKWMGHENAYVKFKVHNISYLFIYLVHQERKILTCVSTKRPSFPLSSQYRFCNVRRGTAWAAMLFSHPQCLAVLLPCYCRPAAAYPTFTQLNPIVNRHERKHGASYGFTKKVYINETYREREGNFLQRTRKGMGSYVQFSVLATATS